ncbi:MAG TPA: hypothetical protein VIM65_19135 [Cyclobacteriaceae bacterium]
MKKGILLLFVLCCIQHTVFAQKDFRKGFVVTLSGDSVKGLVSYSEGLRAYQKCIFQESGNNNTREYMPSDILSYGFIDNRLFRMKTIDVNNVTQNAFLEVLVEGPLNLYRYGTFFYVEKDGKLQKLRNDKKETYQRADYLTMKKVILDSNEYIATLNMLMFDCVELRPRIQKIRLGEAQLTRLFERYNNCKGKTSKAYKDKKPWIKSYFGVSGGLNMSTLHVRTQNPELWPVSATYRKSLSPLIGISLEIAAPRVSERFSFHSNVYFLTSKYYHYSLINYDSYALRNSVTVDVNQIKIPLSLCYTFPHKKITPFIKIGASHTINLKHKSELFQETETGNIIVVNKGNAFWISSGQVGIWGGFGFLKSLNKKYDSFIEFRYEQTKGLLATYHNPDLRSGVTNIQIVLGIKMK